MEEIRLRFPPSPTGYLHIGSARTALYNWLFARKHGGKLVFRIEDTDMERSTEEAAKAIIEGLKWLGITWDLGPYYQSDFAQEHREAAERLLEQGKAYRCFCTKEELEEKRKAAQKEKREYGYDRTCRSIPKEESDRRASNNEPFVIRFKVPDSDEPVVFEDKVYGRIVTNRKEIDDFVIVRSNKVPLYILSNVVDDHRDRVTHIIRGADHITNTPKQVLLYQAFGWPTPVFAHMSLTLDSQKAKISKRRHGEMATVAWYKEHGFLPWAFCNFLALLGWNAGDDREYFPTSDELVEAFSLEGLSKTNAVFNYRKGDPKFITDPKAIHINSLHLRSMAIESLLPYVKSELEKAGLWKDNYDSDEREWFVEMVDLLRARYNLTTDFATLGRPYFTEDYEIEEKAMKKGLKKDPGIKEYLPVIANKLEALDPFDKDAIEMCLRELAENYGVKVGILTNAVRAAVTGQNVGPGLFELLPVMGRGRVVARIRRIASSLG
ncbi:MAG: glutamate--tRNA ligase [Deltaproteobacteria bacterium]|nr:glutamate--tRNA ligase [Deltaproteobacteria bacterium]